ncbi:uncharacterized protein LOC109792853 [Cajanus cajan]|uniref:uncharacterized protein LOC109792853 n=1 Tax=Cajanus cajan TaxID=3821 RepID=UPI00098DBDFF|nr:uncharacterized protein LOC109792853 [Cajanus cajan]
MLGELQFFDDRRSFHDRSQPTKRGILELDTQNAILAQNKLLSQQMEELKKQMSKLQVGSSSRPQQVFTTNQKNTEASIRNLEVQIGQLAKQLAEQQSNNFSAKTQVNPKEYCQSITTRRGIVIGKGIGDNLKENKDEVDEEKSEVELKSEREVEKDKERQFARFLDIIKRLQINIPFAEALEQMPSYARFMKELLTKKRKLSEDGIVELEAGCSAIIQKSLPQKSRDPGSFTLPITIGNLSVGKALLDLGSSINLMPLSMLQRIGDVEVKPTKMTLQLADRSIKYPHGIVEDLLVKVDKFFFPVDFVVMDMEEDSEVPLILGRPFMKTAKVIIDVDDGKLKVRVHGDESKVKSYHDKKIVQRKFQPGQQALLLNSRLRLFPGKFKSKWSDPFVIKSAIPPGAVELEEPNSRRSGMMNGQRIMPHLGGEVEKITTVIHLNDP